MMPQPRLPRWRILAALPAPLRFRMSARALALHARGPARHCDGCAYAHAHAQTNARALGLAKVPLLERFARHVL